MIIHRNRKQKTQTPEVKKTNEFQVDVELDLT